MRHQAIAAAALLFASVPAVAANLVTNGNFEAGNTAFTSDYTYIAPAGDTSLYPESAYTVDTNARNVHNLWKSYGDHTTGQGNYLIVNGATEPGATVWESGPIAVTPGSNYFFEAFASNMCCGRSNGATSNLTFTVVTADGPVALSSFATEATPGVWKGYSTQWNNSNQTSVILRLVDNSLDFGGNDFGIDDINFGTDSVVPEPATWAMLITGFGLVGFAARRRRTLSQA